MTLRRAPLTIDAALARIAGQVQGGWAAMAKEIGKSESLLRAWGHPARRENIPLVDAINLDLAYRAAGGDGAPLFETYGYQLDEAGLFRFTDAVALGRLTAEAIKEGGEAYAALVTAAQPGADPTCYRETIREVDEAVEKLHGARTVVDGMLRATGPPGED